MIVQGQELLEARFFHEKDPVDWSRVESQRGILQMYTDLFRLRRNWQHTTAGLTGPNVQVYHANNADNVVVFHRWKDGGPGDSVVVLASFSKQGRTDYSVGFPAGGLWQVRFNSDWQGYDPQFGQQDVFAVEAVEGEYDGMPYHGKVALGPYSVVILSQDRPAGG
jgi:1,4-alpha-glucan branching enzyme